MYYVSNSKPVEKPEDPSFGSATGGLCSGVQMPLDQFNRELKDLQTSVVATITTHFSDKDRVFDIREFMELTGACLEDVLKSAYFHGAQVFPEVE